MKLTIRYFVLFFAGLWCLLAGVKADPDQIKMRISNEVKAAYILNFLRYTEWPIKKFPDANDPVVLCVLGNDPFGNILEQTFQGKEITGRNLKVNRLGLVSSPVNECHAVFISKIENNQVQVQQALRSLENLPVLTVSDSDGLSPDAIIIHFISFQETIQFEINLRVAEKRGLKISSRMIPLAKKVTN